MAHEETVYEALDHAHGGEGHWAFGTGFDEPLAGVDTTVPEGIDPADLGAYCLMLGDDALVLCQRLTQWVTNAPELEEEDAHMLHTAPGGPALRIVKRWLADGVPARLALDVLPLRDRHVDERWDASLPVAGESETLLHRMRYTPAQGNLHAKTGTTDHVISLGGYVTAADGEVLAFSFIYNGNDRWNARTTIDQMGATLAGFARN